MRLRAMLMACMLIPSLSWSADGQLRIPDFKGLKDKATDSVHISLGSWLLHTAAHFIGDSDEDADSVATKRVLAGIKSIEIHSYTFATDFAYSMTDIDGVRKQLSAPGWSQLVQVHDAKNNQDVDMYIMMSDNRASGFALIASEPKEFTIINVVGSFSPDDLPELQKHFHIHQSTLGRLDY